MRLSISKIQDFEKCPYSFWHSNINRTKIQHTPEQLRIGVEVHEMMEDISKKENYKEIAKTHPKYKEHKIHADNFVKFSDELKEQDANTIPLYTEIKLYDKELNIAGVIDRVDFDGESIAVIDYKTGKDNGIKKHRFQLGVYKYLFDKNHNQKVDYWGIYYSKNNKLYLEKADSDVVFEAVERIKKVRKNIQHAINTDNFPKTPSWMCNWCTWWQNGKCDKGTGKLISIGDKHGN